MPKWLGNRFGDAVPLNPGGEAPSAVYNMHDQYYMRQEGGWTTAQVTPLSYLMVAGGGAGGVDMAGGGGGGGFFHGTFSAGDVLQDTDYAVTIGAGGGAGSNPSANGAGSPGNDSSLAYEGGELRAAGGGCGGGTPTTSPRPNADGFAGGSGGGARGATGGVGGADDTFPSEPTTPAPLRGQGQVVLMVPQIKVMMVVMVFNLVQVRVAHIMEVAVVVPVQ